MQLLQLVLRSISSFEMYHAVRIVYLLRLIGMTVLFLPTNHIRELLKIAMPSWNMEQVMHLQYTYHSDNPS